MQQMIKNRGQKCVSNYSTQQVEICHLYTLCRTISKPGFPSGGFMANTKSSEMLLLTTLIGVSISSGNRNITVSVNGNLCCAVLCCVCVCALQLMLLASTCGSIRKLWSIGCCAWLPIFWNQVFCDHVLTLNRLTLLILK